MLDEGTMNVKAIDPARGAHLKKITPVTSARASVHPARES
jgi:hypothetical protein